MYLQGKLTAQHHPANAWTPAETASAKHLTACTVLKSDLNLLPVE